MDYTPEQQEAQLALQTAIENHVQAFRRRSSDDSSIEVTGDWMVIASVTILDPMENGDRKYTYHMGFNQGEMPEHTAFGLLRMGENLLTSGEMEEE